MAKPTEREELLAFVERNPEAELTGFFWYDRDFRVVVLAALPSRKCEAAEFSGATPEELIELADRWGFELGSPDRVRQNCETAPRSALKRRRRTT